jgi:hypothetical protein
VGARERVDGHPHVVAAARDRDLRDVEGRRGEAAPVRGLAALRGEGEAADGDGAGAARAEGVVVGVAARVGRQARHP